MIARLNAWRRRRRARALHRAALRQWTPVFVRTLALHMSAAGTSRRLG